MAVFEKRTLIGASPEWVFAFHERPDALERLTPPWEHTRIVERTGRGIEAGVRVVLEMRSGPLRQRWVAEHVEYDPPRRFRDVQRSGPFAGWEPPHLVEPAAGGALLVDLVAYELPFGPLGLLAGWYLRRGVARLSDHRHDVTKKACEVQP